MRGMLIKDFQLLKTQKLFYGIILAISILMVLEGEKGATFVVSYGTLLLSMFTLSTISYDEYENGAPYLFTMPIDTQSYVREKYLYGFLLTVIAWTASSLAVTAASVYRRSIDDLGEYGFVLFFYLVMTLAFLAITIPVQLKFGSEKSRSAILMFMGAGVLATFLAVRLINSLKLDLSGLMNRIAEASPLQFVLLELAVCALILFVSYRVSLHILRKREY